ncbi:MAG: hypothetical protein FWF34_02035 [Alphaproteobacteria bacterium]|nr:hypothetical protein [Alphaproteobacteria bacterium]MCL2890011.1 hypothetical protein [Alphaproteobacteria bacterium]
MKTSCPFCKTEYSVTGVPTRVACAACGNEWAPVRAKNNFLLIFASICALLATLVFAIVITIKSPRPRKSPDPLIIESVQIIPTESKDNAHGFMVTGTVRNITDKIYGIPDMALELKNDSGDVIETIKIMPPAPLLDAGEHANFKQEVQIKSQSVRRANVVFAD